MKRSFLISALILALSPAVTACSSNSAEPAKDGDSVKKDDESASSSDPVEELQKISDGLQKDVEAVLQPLKDADAIIESVANIPKDLKAAKSKADAKKVMAQLKVVIEGKEADIAVLKLDEAGGKIVTERHEKLKALMASLKDVDTKAKELVAHIGEAAPKLITVSGKATATIELKLKRPMLGADDKKKLEDDKAKITAIVDGFKTKAAEWQKALTDMPPKTKEIPGKFAKAFK